MGWYPKRKEKKRKTQNHENLLAWHTVQWSWFKIYFVTSCVGFHCFMMLHALMLLVKQMECSTLSVMSLRVTSMDVLSYSKLLTYGNITTGNFDWSVIYSVQYSHCNCTIQSGRSWFDWLDSGYKKIELRLKVTNHNLFRIMSFCSSQPVQKLWCNPDVMSCIA